MRWPRCQSWISVSPYKIMKIANKSAGSGQGGNKRKVKEQEKKAAAGKVGDEEVLVKKRA